MAGIAFLKILPDNHKNAWFLSNTECEEATLRTIENQTGVDMLRVSFGFYLLHDLPNSTALVRLTRTYEPAMEVSPCIRDSTRS